MTLTAVEKESLRRTKWEADNTDSEVNKFIYKAVYEYIRAKKLQEKHKQEQKQLEQMKKLYIDENKTLEEVADITGIDIAYLSQVIFQNGWNEEKKSNKGGYNTGSKGTGMFLAQSFGKGLH